MAITVTYSVDHQNIIGQKRQRQNRVKLSLAAGTYPSGGVSLTAASLGLPSAVESLKLIDSDDSSGIVWKYDFSNNKLRGYKTQSAVGPVIVEEQVAVSGNAGTLSKLPAHIYMVESTAGSTTGPFKVIPTGETPVTTEVAVTMTSGTLTFLGTDAVTECRVSYLPLEALSDPTDLVTDESLTMSSNTNKLANDACLIQCIYDGTNSKRYAIREKGIAAASLSTKECSVDFTPAAGNTQVTSNDTDDVAGTAVLKVTYVKDGAAMVSGPLLTLVEEEATSLSSEEGVTASPGLPSTGQYLNGTAGTAGPHTLTTQYQTKASMSNGEARWTITDGAVNKPGSDIAFDASVAVTSCKITYVKLFPKVEVATGKLQELATSETTSAQTLYVEATGY